MTDPAITDAELEARCINVIRGLAMDAPHAARSGHQGTAMALAPLAHVLFTRVMKYDASNPTWADRDRFILSPGHASILQYAMLHLTGFGLTLDDLKDFRQWNSATPGHPEVGHTAGVEVTTGPLGQGFAHGVGMGMAERSLRTQFGPDAVNHRTWVICSDGDLAEGISHEAASLAGHLGLGGLIYIYDDNRVSIDGHTDTWLSDDAGARFEALGWHVIRLGDAGEDLDAIEAALNEAAAVEDRPSMIVLQTHIGTPSPELTDHHSAHGYAFTDDEITSAKAVMGLPDEPFHVPDDVLDFYRAAGTRGADARAAWTARVDDTTAAALGSPPVDAAALADALPTWEPGDSIATRKASNACLDAAGALIPSLLPGSCDLTGNTGVKLAGAQQLTAEVPDGRQIFYGVREHAMVAAMNGMALHGGMIPVGGTFLVFSDYCRPAVRLAALQGCKEIYSFTHDSIGVGEDGPTHQPVEHVAALRAIPDLRVIRPADANEVAGAWHVALTSDGPTALILTRQNVPVLEAGSAADVANGAYVLSNPDGAVITLLGAGSEVQHCVAAAETLAAEGIAARVVSMPSWELFEESSADHKAAVFTGGPVLAIEAGSSMGWHRWADDVIGIDRFGASAPGSTVMSELGMTSDNVVAGAKALLAD